MSSGEVARLPVASPFRLDYTVALLRRFETNVVDRLTSDGAYVRSFGDGTGGATVAVRQPAAGELTVEVTGGLTAADALPLVVRTLGLEADTAPFLRRGAAIPWLGPALELMRGVRPPRYPSLFEACVNAVVFQQVSIAAASAMLRRTIELLSPRRRFGDLDLYAFPSASRFAAATESELHGCGLSLAKAAAVRRIADAILDGSLGEASLAPLDSAGIAGRLCALKGIGPWSAAVVLLRGFGRLDVFPEGDSGAARSLQMLAPGLDAVAVREARTILGDCEGMLYYTLLMGRLAARGALPRATAGLPAVLGGS